MIKEIEMLNKRIDKLMTEKTKYDAQKEVWENNLSESIKAYQKEYGIDLSGNTLAEIKKKLSSEINIVETKTKEEFEKSSKIVNLINEGDIKGAWELLGVNKEEENTQEVVSEEKPKQHQEIQSAIEAVEEIEDDDFYGESFEEEDDYIEDTPLFKSQTPVVNEALINNNFKSNTVPKKEEPKPFNSFIIEDDDEEDEFVVPNTSAPMVDDDDDDFGGFGGILAGSKFQV